MLVTIRLSVKAGEQIEKLVRSGKYASFEDFARLALENQLVAEADGLPLWGAALRSAAAGTTTEPMVQEARQESHQPAGSPPPVPVLGVRERPDSVNATAGEARGVPKELLSEVRAELRVPGGRAPTAAKPDLTGADGWPWGQWNRFFPVKLACRVILREAKEGRWMAPRLVLERIGEMAQLAARALIAMDRAAGRGRDEALAVALPGSDSKSVDRFVSQFVGHLTKAGPRVGAASVYQMCALTENTLALTEAGIAFGRMSNPFLDGTHEVRTLLSSEERQFLIELIGGRVPGEQKSFVTVMGAISGGSTRFDDVVADSRKSGPESWSDAMIRTQVSGTLARLHELDLIEKERTGQRVKYGLTSSGAGLLRRWRKGE